MKMAKALFSGMWWLGSSKPPEYGKEEQTMKMAKALFSGMWWLGSSKPL